MSSGRNWTTIGFSLLGGVLLVFILLPLVPA